MDTQTQRATYPYGTFAKIAEAVGATHTSTRRKVHHWHSDRYALTYFAKERAFTIARADCGPIVTVDATLTPGIVGPLTDEERAMLAAVGLPIDTPTRSEAPGRAQPTATTEHPTPAPIAPETSAPPRIPAPTKPRRTATPKPAPPADDEPAADAAPAEGIRVSVQAFRDALKATKGSVLTKTALPILQCAVIDYADGWITITTTNLETAVQRRLPAAGATPARYAIDHKALSGLTADKAASWVITPAAPHGATFTSPTGAATLAGMDAPGYPVIPAVPTDAPSATIYREIAARAFTNAAAAAAKDDSRPVLAGIHLDTKEGAPAMLYAADGFRANACPLDYEGELQDVIVPARFAAVLTKAIETDARALTVTGTPAAGGTPPMLHVSSDRTTVTTRTIDGTHPDMRQIFPREFSTVATLPRAAMLSAVEQAEKIAKNNNDVVVLTADPAANTLTVSAKTAEGGSYSAAVPMTDYRGDANPAKIAFNGNYLADALKAAGDTHVELRTNTPHTPGMIADSVDRFLLMPMVTKD